MRVKKHHMIIGLICSIVTLGSGMGIFVRHMFNVYVSDMVAELTGVKDEVLSEEGFYDKRTETEDSDYEFIEGHSIREEDFMKLEYAEECWMKHFDLYFDDAVSFVTSKLNEWAPYDWIQRESLDYTEFEYKRDLNRYTKEIYWYSEEHGGSSIEPSIRINADPVTGRIHWISFTLPYEDNSKTAFLQIMNWLGYDGDAEFVFNKLVDTELKVGDDLPFGYKKDGFDFSIGISDYLNSEDIGTKKLYSISILPENNQIIN